MVNNGRSLYNHISDVLTWVRAHGRVRECTEITLKCEERLSGQWNFYFLCYLFIFQIFYFNNM